MARLGQSRNHRLYVLKRAPQHIEDEIANLLGNITVVLPVDGADWEAVKDAHGEFYGALMKEQLNLSSISFSSSTEFRSLLVIHPV